MSVKTGVAAVALCAVLSVSACDLDTDDAQHCGSPVSVDVDGKKPAKPVKPPKAPKPPKGAKR